LLQYPTDTEEEVVSGSLAEAIQKKAQQDIDDISDVREQCARTRELAPKTLDWVKGDEVLFAKIEKEKKRKSKKGRTRRRKTRWSKKRS